MFVCGLHHMVTGSASCIVIPVVAQPGEFTIEFVDRWGLTNTSACVRKSLNNVLRVLPAEVVLPFEYHDTPPLDYRRFIEFTVDHVPRAVARCL